jgi:hypothetical protein
VRIGQVHAADGDGDHLGAGGLDRGGGLFEILVFAGADDQAGGEAAAGDGPGVVVERGGSKGAVHHVSRLR